MSDIFENDEQIKRENVDEMNNFLTKDEEEVDLVGDPEIHIESIKVPKDDTDEENDFDDKDYEDDGDDTGWEDEKDLKKEKKHSHKSRKKRSRATGPISKAEKLKKKKMAERARREKLRSDPQQYEVYKAKQRDRYIRLKAENKIKSIKDLSPREQQMLRQRSRENSKAYYQRKKMRMLEQAGYIPPSEPCLTQRRPRAKPLHYDFSLPNKVSMKEKGFHYIITIS